MGKKRILYLRVCLSFKAYFHAMTERKLIFKETYFIFRLIMFYMVEKLVM